MKDFRSKLSDLRKSLSAKDASIFLSVVVLSAFATFAVFDSNSSLEDTMEVMFTEELNHTHNSATLDFFNESMEFSMEQGSETTFYIDLDAEGNADMQLENLTRDGKIRSSSKIFDYPSGVYVLHFSYHLGDNDEEHWLRPERMEKLG